MDDLGDFGYLKMPQMSFRASGAATGANRAQLAPQRARKLDLQGLGGRQEMPRPQFLRKADEGDGELTPSRRNARGRKEKSAGGETRLNPPGEARAPLGFRRGSAWNQSSDDGEGEEEEE